MSMKTLTVRAHDEHREIIKRTAARLKAEPTFAARLNAFLAAAPSEAPPPDALAALTARVAALEARFASMPAAPAPAEPSQICEQPSRKPSTPAAKTPERTEPDDGTLDMFPDRAPEGSHVPAGEERPAQATTSLAPLPAGLASRPKRHRLTDQQRAEIVQRDGAGERVMVISRAMGIPQPTVSHALKVARASKDSAA